MIRHIALFRWAEGTRADQIEAVTAGLSTLPGLIPELRAYRVGPDLGITEGTFDFAVVADLDDESAFVAYRDHPAHRAVIIERIRPFLAERAAVQYEIGPGTA